MSGGLLTVLWVHLGTDGSMHNHWELIDGFFSSNNEVSAWYSIAGVFPDFL